MFIYINYSTFLLKIFFFSELKRGDNQWEVKVKTTVLRMLLADMGHLSDSFGRHSSPFYVIKYDVPGWTSLGWVYWGKSPAPHKPPIALNSRMAQHLVLGRCSTVAFGIPYQHLAAIHSVCRAFFLPASQFLYSCNIANPSKVVCFS